MLKKGQLVKFTRPVSTMKLVYEAIEQGFAYRYEVVKETNLKENQVRSAIWNLSFIGAIKKVQDDQGRSRYVIPGVWVEPVADCLCGVNSIFNVSPFTSSHNASKK